MEVYGINRNPYEAADELGLDVVLPNPNQLQLDIDSEEQYRSFLLNLRTLERDTNVTFGPFTRTPSKSGFPKCHITLTTTDGKPMDVWKRIALQFYLQSDPVREGLNCKRVLLGDPYPIAFFEVKSKC